MWWRWDELKRLNDFCWQFFILQNAFFIHALEAEQKSYQKVEPVFEQQNQIIKQTAEHMNTIEVDILKNALRKIKLATVDPQGTP